jgi:hypothetical protein
MVGERRWAWFGKVTYMPQDAEAFVGRSLELAVLSAAHLGQAVRTGTRCSYTPPDG